MPPKICLAKRSGFDVIITFTAISIGIYGILQNIGVLAVSEGAVLKSSGDSFTSILAFVVIIMVFLFYSKTRKGR